MIKPVTGPDAAYITIMAITIAATMISICSAMPIAVMIEVEGEHEIDHDQLHDRPEEGSGAVEGGFPSCRASTSL